MILKQTLWSAGIVAWVCALSGSAEAQGCLRTISPSGDSARVVAIAGGDAWDLFRQYLDTAKQQKLNISVWRSSIQLHSNGRTERVELGWFKMLTGESPERLWEKALKGRKAEIDDKLLRDAVQNKWDVFCDAPVQQTRATNPPRPKEPLPGDPSRAIVYFKSGMQYASRSDYKNALKEFQSAEAIDPSLESLQMNIGLAFMGMKDYVQAAAHLSRAVDEKPTDPMARYNMACLQARLGQKDDAVASLKAAKSHGLNMTPEMRQDPDLAQLRGRRDFDSLFAKHQ